MNVIVHQSAEYIEYNTHVIDKLPEDWDDMTTDEQFMWVIHNGRYLETESVFVGGGEVIEVEVEEEA
jgi:hypothetical protein